jgi:hypothetical protein
LLFVSFQIVNDVVEPPLEAAPRCEKEHFPA